MFLYGEQFDVRQAAFAFNLIVAGPYYAYVKRGPCIHEASAILSMLCEKVMPK